MKIMLVISALRNGGAERVVELLSHELGKNHQIETLYFEENLNLYKISGKLTAHNNQIISIYSCGNHISHTNFF